MSTTDPITPADLAGCLAITSSVLRDVDPFEIIDLAHDKTDSRWAMLSGGEKAVVQIAVALRTVESLTGSIDKTWQARVAMVLDDLSSAMRSGS